MYHPDCMTEVIAAFNSFVQTGRVANMELALKKKDGTKIPVLLNVESVRDANGNTIYSNSCWRDITERKEMERQLEEQIIQMKIYQAKLEKDHAMKDRLISMIGHDIITPLHFVSYAGKKLVGNRGNLSDEAYADIVKNIVDACDNLKDMSSNMLNWIKLHSENVKFNPEPMNLCETIQQVVNNMMPISKLNEIIIVNETSTDITLNQYKEPLKNIFLQLLSNAIKYCKGCNTNITSAQNLETVTITVTDDGPGMSAQKIANITGAAFDANAESDTQESHGFGYLIIRDMLAIIGGEMAIDSRLSQGTSVQISFPANIKVI